MVSKVGRIWIAAQEHSGPKVYPALPGCIDAIWSASCHLDRRADLPGHRRLSRVGLGLVLHERNEMQPNTRPPTHTMGAQRQHKKSGWTKLLGNCRAALDIFHFAKELRKYPPPPLVQTTTPKSQINRVPTPTVAWTRA